MERCWSQKLLLEISLYCLVTWLFFRNPLSKELTCWSHKISPKKESIILNCLSFSIILNPEIYWWDFLLFLEAHVSRGRFCWRLNLIELISSNHCYTWQISVEMYHLCTWHDPKQTNARVNHTWYLKMVLVYYLWHILTYMHKKATNILLCLDPDKNEKPIGCTSFITSL